MKNAKMEKQEEGGMESREGEIQHGWRVGQDMTGMEQFAGSISWGSKPQARVLTLSAAQPLSKLRD